MKSLTPSSRVQLPLFALIAVVSWLEIFNLWSTVTYRVSRSEAFSHLIYLNFETDYLGGGLRAEPSVSTGPKVNLVAYDSFPKLKLHFRVPLDVSRIFVTDLTTYIETSTDAVTSADNAATCKDFTPASLDVPIDTAQERPMPPQSVLESNRYHSDGHIWYLIDMSKVRREPGISYKQIICDSSETIAQVSDTERSIHFESIARSGFIASIMGVADVDDPLVSSDEALSLDSENVSVPAQDWVNISWSDKQSEKRHEQDMNLLALLLGGVGPASALKTLQLLWVLSSPSDLKM